MVLEEQTEDVELEDVLSKFKLTGRYYMKFFILVVLTTITNEMYFFNYIFAAADVDYRCQYPNCKGSQMFSERLILNKTNNPKCYRFDLKNNNGYCNFENLNQSSIIKCDEWEYKESQSFVAEFNIACQDWKRTLVGTVHGVGYMIGLLILGPVSDKMGRKKTIIITGIIGGVLGFSRSLSYFYWLYVALELLEAIIGDTCTATYTYNIEMATKDNRVLFNTILQTTYGLTDVIVATIAWLVPYWRHYLRTLYSTSLVFLFYWFFMDESVRWLLSTGRKSEAVEILKKAAQRDNVFIEENTWKRLKCNNETSDMNLLKLIKITISSKVLLLRLLGCACMWTTSSFTTYTFLINSVSLEGNKYLNYGLTGAMYIPASLSLLYILDKFKRKKPLVISFLLTGVLCMVQTFVPQDYKWTGLFFFLGGTFMSSLSLPIVYLYTSEIFPTYTRNTMHALCAAIGRIGGILATQTPLLIKYWPGLPALLIGILSLAAGVISMLMPDTADDRLPDNVDQAKAIGMQIKAADVKETKIRNVKQSSKISLKPTKRELMSY